MISHGVGVGVGVSGQPAVEEAGRGAKQPGWRSGPALVMEGPGGLEELDSVNWMQPPQGLRGRGQLLPSLPSKGCLGPVLCGAQLFLLT